MFFPLSLILILPLTSALVTFLTDKTVNADTGKLVINTFNASSVNISLENPKSIELIDNTKLFYTQINNRENDRFGFKELYYTTSFYDKDEKLISKSQEIKDFILPKEIFYITKIGPAEAIRMQIDFDLSKSKIRNTSENIIKKIDSFKLDIYKLSTEKSSEKFMSVNFGISNQNGKVLENVTMQYKIVASATDDTIVYIGNYNFSEIKPGDNDNKSISNIVYPKNFNRDNIAFIGDYNKKLRYNLLNE